MAAPTDSIAFARCLHSCVNDVATLGGAGCAVEGVGGGSSGPGTLSLLGTTLTSSSDTLDWMNLEPLFLVQASQHRLTIPLHWGLVEDGVYRSGFPVPETFPTLKRLGLKTVVNLQDRLPLEYKEFLADNEILYVHAPVKGNKVHPEEMDSGRVSAVLALLSNTSYHPILVHCECVVRRLARMSRARPCAVHAHAPHR